MASHDEISSEMSDKLIQISSHSLSILSLPPELISEILSCLSAEDISQASIVCRQFYEACNADYVWKVRCRDEFEIIDISSWNCSYKDLYTKVLFHYGWMIGLWQQERGHYGGLISVKMITGTSNARLEGWRYDPPNPTKVENDLKSQILFTVEIHNGDVLAQCQKTSSAHPVELTMNPNQELCYKCTTPAMHDHQEDGSDFWRWLQDEYGLHNPDIDVFDQDLYLRKYNTFRKHECEFSCKRLLPLKFIPNALVQPGFFKGDYSAHGVEIIKLGYTEDLQQLEMLKITGDPNIPAGCISMKVDLTQPMVLTLAQQEYLDMLTEMDLPDPDPELEVERLPSQPFRVPIGCTREGGTAAPAQCRWRFSAMGQVAYDNYTTPTFISGHFIIFDQDTLGFLWMDLQAFCLLKRCTERDLACS